LKPGRGLAGRMLSLLAVTTGVLILPTPSSASATSGAGIARAGVVDPVSTKPLMIDPAGRRLYVNSGRGTLVIREYDLDRPFGSMLLRKVPVPLRNVSLSNFEITPDWQNHRAFLLDRDLQPTPPCPYCSYIRVLDLRSLSFNSRQWQMNDLVPNFYPEGITYSASDRRLYVTGSMVGYPAYFFSVFSVPFYPTTILSIDVDTGKLAWLRTLTKCLRPMSGYAIGGGIFRSVQLPALYVGCARADTTSVAGVPYPGHTGVDRLWIDPKSDAVGALSFREDFFETSGSFASVVGMQTRVDFDYASERFFICSSAFTTPGTWVFDGLLNVWAGFIPAEDTNSMALGVNQGTGHVYLRAGGDGRVVVTEGRRTPVPQGNVYRVAGEGSQADNLTTFLADPVTERVFIPSTVSGRAELVALQDSLPPSGREDVDYDSLTGDIPESADTFSTFAAGGSGFGMHALLVGGAGGATSPTRNGLATFFVDSAVGRTVGISPGDRGTWAARVPLLDMRNVAASASAKAVGMDDLTTNDLRNAQQQVAELGPSPSPSSAPVGSSVAPLANWPWSQTACLDSEGNPAEPPKSTAPFGDAEVRCDLAHSKVDASSHATVGALGNVSVARTGFEGESHRTQAAGITATLAAYVRGLEVAIPGTGTLRIANVEQTVTTKAHGRSRTAHVTWNRVIEGVQILDASGHVTYACGATCDADAVASRVNDAFGLQLHMIVPDPEIVATPRGAFAGFQKSYSQYINDLVMNNDSSHEMPAVELEIYNDWSDKSRVFLQLAAIQSTATYGITSTAFGSPSSGGPTLSTLPGIPDRGQGLNVERNNDDARLAEKATGRPPAKGLLQTGLFLIRSPGAALSTALLMTLLGGLVALALRRKSLLEVLTEGHTR
jgi:hypothetical protein